MQTHFFSWKKKRVSDPKENHRGDFVFPPNPLETTKGLPPFGIHGDELRTRNATVERSGEPLFLQIGLKTTFWRGIV